MRALVIVALAALVALAGTGTGARAEPAAAVRVIVNAKNADTKLDRRFVADAFLKKRTRWSDDTAIQPVDLNQKSRARERFSHDVLDRDIAAVRRYWAQLVFSGRGVPPPELGSDAEVVKYVAEHAGAIGYVSGETPLAGNAVTVVEVE